jgi:hypothetical protein
MSLISATSSFTRPNDTTAYAANDLVANNTTAGSVTPLSFQFNSGNGRSFKIVGCRINKNNATVTNANFHLRLYGTSPTVTGGDNAAWVSSTSNYIGKIDPAIMEAFSDGGSISGNVGAGSELYTYLPSGNIIYGLLVADAAYTPTANEVFTVTLFADVNR